MRLLAAIALAACSGKSASQDKPKPAAVKLDAGVYASAPQPVHVDPSGMHLDEAGEHKPIIPPAPQRAPRPIDVTLRSTPPGAQVMVDGTIVGYTPTFWPGDADGREHEFLFVMSGFATARYRFVPVTSGVIHARLEPIVEEPDAGVPEQPPEGAPVPGAGSALVNPPPAPAPPPAADAPAPPGSANVIGPQP